MIWGNISYNYPELGYLIFGIIPIFILFFFLFYYRSKILENFAKPNLLIKLLLPRSNFLYWLKVCLYCLAWAFAVLALMQPKGNGHYPPWAQKAESKTIRKEQVELRRKAHKIVFLIDASASMSVKDSANGENRLSDAKDIVDEIVSELTGESVALYTFTSEVTRLVPATMDYLFFRIMLPQIVINEGDVAGTNFKEAITQMMQREFPEPVQELNTLILLSDGGDTNIDSLNGSSKSQAINNLANMFKDAEKLNLRVVTVGIGSAKGENIPGITYRGKPVSSHLENDILQQLSNVGRGQYYNAKDYQTIPLAQNIVAFIGKDTPFVEKQSVLRNAAVNQEDLVYDLYFQIPLSLALLCLALAIVLPDTKLIDPKKITNSQLKVK